MTGSSVSTLVLLSGLAYVAWASVLLPTDPPELSTVNPKNNVRAVSVIRWCTLSDPEQAKCEALAAYLVADSNYRIRIQCNRRQTRSHCFWEISKGQLDAVSAWRSQAYFASKHFGLYPLLGEEYLEGALEPRHSGTNDTDDVIDNDGTDSPRSGKDDDDERRRGDEDDVGDGDDDADDDDDDADDADDNDDNDDDDDDDKKRGDGDKEKADGDRDKCKDKGQSTTARPTTASSVRPEIVTRVPILKPRPSFAYIAVAVVRKSNIGITGLESLRGCRSCHTGVGRSAGWILPMSLLAARGLLGGRDCLDNVEGVAKFFSKSCVPGSQNPIYNSLGENVTNLCELCAGDCTFKDPYAGYHGAMKCLLDGKGEVAFVKHSTALEVTAGEVLPGRRSSDFELLCPDGSRASLERYRQCNWGVVPPQAVYVSSHLSPQTCQDLRAVLLDIASNPRGFRLFESNSYGGKNLLFRDATKKLYHVKSKDYRDHTGRSYIRAMENQTSQCDQSRPSIMRWCVTSEAENAKCCQMSQALDAVHVKPRLQCIQTRSVEECAALIVENLADLLSLDAGEIFKAGWALPLIPILYEEYGKKTDSYWSVAVVKKSDQTISWNNLRGRNACFSGVGHAAGWIVPVYQLWRSGHLPSKDHCQLAADVSRLFRRSCAPGAPKPVARHHLPTPLMDNLCHLCSGSGSGHCACNTDEPYYGPSGALRCLVEGGGDVAFVNELTVLENTDGYNNAPWAQRLASSDFELLCTDGTRRPVARYNECNLGKVPADTIVTSSAKTESEINAFIHAIQKAQHHFRNDSHVDFRLYDSCSVTSKDLIFRDSTHCLTKIKPESRNWGQWLGAFYPIAEFVSTQRCPH